ncbi:MAG: hypothetical protein ACK4SW_07435, partial [Sulfurihydrogenibium azorense]
MEEFELYWNRYYLENVKIEDYGYAEFISKSMLRVKTDKKTDLIQEGLIVPIKINGKEYRCFVKEITET